jgi:hypothetical protein
MNARTASFLLALSGTLAGCAPGGGGGAGPEPRDRLGALPFPGPFTLYATADPARLGTHRYGRWPRPFAASGDEKERGIIYATRAGFLDVAHVRIAIDWGRYCTRAARAALVGGRTALAVPGPDHGVFHVAIEYPPAFAALPPDQRARIVDASAHRIGQRVAYVILTWHEVATWFGYRSFLFDESRSAFTYDDTVATLIGLRVAGRAMTDAGADASDQAFEIAATAALDDELHRLGACTPVQTERAVRAVEGVWWADGKPLKRQADVDGAVAAVVHPWLVPDLPFATDPSAGAAGFPVPSNRVPPGAAIAVTARVTIEPRIGQAAAMRALLPARPEQFSEEHDLPALLEAMRRQMRTQYGPDVGRPWPAADAAAAAAAGRLGSER